MNYNKGYQNRLDTAIYTYVTSTFFTMFGLTPSLIYNLVLSNRFIFETGVSATAYILYGKNVTTKMRFNGNTSLGYKF